MDMCAWAGGAHAGACTSRVSRGDCLRAHDDETTVEVDRTHSAAQVGRIAESAGCRPTPPGPPPPRYRRMAPRPAHGRAALSTRRARARCASTPSASARTALPPAFRSPARRGEWRRPTGAGGASGAVTYMSMPASPARLSTARRGGQHDGRSRHEHVSRAPAARRVRVACGVRRAAVRRVLRRPAAAAAIERARVGTYSIVGGLRLAPAGGVASRPMGSARFAQVLTH
ncbi:hypothetical protein EVAR_39270_1 [Eumeta japonica]|uniref:Uncharacterized protein n=1 Tax=Eumeta variegata TaxID=151549 RepID=A0A4C1VWP9_EUMVA|nr:hypothetical protein EVAR_39270_1 [Eumeta japonica]